MSKDLVTGALITCLAVSVCMLVPIVGLMGSAFLPVPLLFYRIKLGRQAAAVIALAAFGNAMMLAGGLEVFFFGELLLIGFVLGELMARGWSLERTATTVCGTVLGIGIAGLWTYGRLNGKGLQGTLSEGLRYNLEMTAELYREMGVSQDQLVFLENSVEVLEQLLIGILPALVIGSTLMVVWTSLLTARRVCQRRGMPLPDYGLLDCWKAPEVLVWGVIASGALLLMPGFTVKIAGLNGLLVFMVIYFLQGMAIVAFFFRKKRIPRMARVVLYTLILLQQIVMLAVVVVGFFDTWFNFRKLGKPLTSS